MTCPPSCFRRAELTRTIGLVGWDEDCALASDEQTAVWAHATARDERAERQLVELLNTLAAYAREHSDRVRQYITGRMEWEFSSFHVGKRMSMKAATEDVRAASNLTGSSYTPYNTETREGELFLLSRRHGKCDAETTQDDGASSAWTRQLHCTHALRWLDPSSFLTETINTVSLWRVFSYPLPDCVLSLECGWITTRWDNVQFRPGVVAKPLGGGSGAPSKVSDTAFRTLSMYNATCLKRYPDTMLLRLRATECPSDPATTFSRLRVHADRLDSLLSDTTTRTSSSLIPR